MITRKNLKELERILKEMKIVSVTAPTKDGGIFYDRNNDRYIITGLNIQVAVKDNEPFYDASVM